jgi:hypothetical protein
MNISCVHINELFLAACCSSNPLFARCKYAHAHASGKSYVLRNKLEMVILTWRTRKGKHQRNIPRRIATRIILHCDSMMHWYGSFSLICVMVGWHMMPCPICFNYDIFHARCQGITWCSRIDFSIKMFLRLFNVLFLKKKNRGYREYKVTD